MPLHAHGEAQGGVLDALDRAVLSPGEGGEAGADAVRGLVVMRADVGMRAEQRPCARGGVEPHGMGAEDVGDRLVALVANDLGQVLVQVAAAHDVEQLHAAADGEGRHVARERGTQQRQLGLVAAGADAARGRVGVGAVVRRIDVGAAGEDDPVERAERLLDRVGERRQQHGPTSGALDRLDVGHRCQRDLVLPDEPACLLDVRGDADDGAHAETKATLGA